MFAKDRSERQQVEEIPEQNQILDAESGGSDPENVSATEAAAGEALRLGEAVLKLQAERDALHDRLARQQAEFENYRKRVAKEQADYREFAIADAIKSFLHILDNFELALKAPKKGEDTDLRKGVELIRKQMEEALHKLGARAIPSTGEPFDPHLHEAIEMVETSEAKDSHVLEELQRGYKLKDRLLRPAMVRVAKNPKK